MSLHVGRSLLCLAFDSDIKPNTEQTLEKVALSTAPLEAASALMFPFTDAAPVGVRLCGKGQGIQGGAQVVLAPHEATP